MDDKLRLIEPCADFLDSYCEACKETWGFVHNDYIIHNPAFYEQWRDNIFDEYYNQKMGLNLPKGYVPSVTFWIVKGEKYIGTVNIRLRLTPGLADYGGNVGIVIRKSQRQKGYAVRALTMAVDVAKKLMISPILMTCTADNEGSLKLLRSMTYKKMETADTFADGVFCKVYRFFF